MENINIKNAIEELKQYIASIHKSATEILSPNIVRGHVKCISTEIEDGIALFVSRISTENHTVLLDPTVPVNGEKHRPDLILLNKENEVEAMIEIEANMGWCRNAKSAIDNIVNNHYLFAQQRTLKCEFSRQETIQAIYKSNVKLFLISFTNGNCSPSKHALNKQYATEKGVFHFNLFSGGYESLNELEIDDFAKKIMK